MVNDKSSSFESSESLESLHLKDLSERFVHRLIQSLVESVYYFYYVILFFFIMTEAHNDMLFGKIDGGNRVALSHWITGKRGATVLPASVLTDCLVRSGTNHKQMVLAVQCAGCLHSFSQAQNKSAVPLRPCTIAAELN